MKPYADTNLLTRLYLVLPDSPEAHALASLAKEGQADPFPMTWLHRSEFVNALQLHVYAGRQPGQVRVTAEQSAIALEQFREDLTGDSFLRTARLSETLLEDEVEELALRYTAKHGFRTYDLLHVAAARLLGCDTFWSFDERAAKLAKLAGLKIHPRPLA